MSEYDETEEMEDDVEAHGLKEIAIGLTAAAALGGGAAAAATSLSASAAPIPANISPVVMQVGHDTHGAKVAVEHSVSNVEHDAHGELGADQPGPIAE